MITILEKLLIKDREDTSSPNVRQAYGILCGVLGICLNLLLFLGKFSAGVLSNSIAITADAFNNLSDAGSSIITLIGFRMAGQKPDPDHPFGHGRIEYISGLLVAVIIIIMAFELIKSSFLKILHPENLSFSPIILLILAVSIAVKCYMALYNRRIGLKIDSTAMKATAMDSMSDSLATSVVLISTLISHYTGLHIDGICGVLVGLFILYAGINTAKDTVSPLLGQAPDPEYVKRINEIVMSYDGIMGIHDLIVHNYGPGRVLISLHAEIPSDGDILTMHDMIDLIEHDLQRQLHCSAVIHMDPVLVGNEETDRLKAFAVECVKTIDAQLSLHDFRIVQGPTHTNMIFDVVAPYKFPMTDSQLTEAVNHAITREHPEFFTVIEVDKPYTPS